MSHQEQGHVSPLSGTDGRKAKGKALPRLEERKAVGVGAQSTSWMQEVGH